MSDQNPPEQGAFGSPAPGSSGPGAPTPGGPGPQGGAPGTEPIPTGAPAPGTTPSAPPPPPASGAGGPGMPPPPPVGPGSPGQPGQPGQPHHEPHQPGGGAGAFVTAGGEALADSSTGFFPALFDFTFNTFVTPKIVRIVYVLAVVWAGLGYLFAVIGGFASSLTTGLVALIFGPIVAIIWLAVVRIGLEFGISVVRMSEDVHRRLPQA
ncbi:DUF4282 domain-containing protein [Intrasporangium sp. YIM S08009]|uniref:DUF4282 domain-containing protein n=1 Tax=Intrasporangium zincisolvens TaxID=3080018 RepID=UPI002B05E15D|nr:DUF4282 domain-containing protein [Intrasporangium sp. YIM S08009]